MIGNIEPGDRFRAIAQRCEGKIFIATAHDHIHATDEKGDGYYVFYDDLEISLVEESFDSEAVENLARYLCNERSYIDGLVWSDADAEDLRREMFRDNARMILRGRM